MKTIGIWYPETWGNGQTTIEVLADPQHRPGLFLLASLLVWKVVATAVTEESRAGRDGGATPRGAKTVGRGRER